MLSIIFKALRKGLNIAVNLIYTPYARWVLYLNNASFGKNLKINGFLKVHITRKGSMCLGDNVKINSGYNHNIIGRQQKSIFWVDGSLKIGHNTGMSATAIICNDKIEIGDNVLIGGNTVIYDTDFHSLDPKIRFNKNLDKKTAKKGKVTIGNNVFIGSHSTILKGVSIGNNSVIGACSLVSKNVPENQIWAGNPIRFIKNLD